MAANYREQALSLLAAAKNHGDLAVKISSLKQAKEILLSVDPLIASELFQYGIGLQSSPETLVRKCFVEMMEELSLKAMQRSNIFMPILLQLVKDDSPEVVRQSIVSGTHCFCVFVEEMFNQSNKFETWLEELWLWMGKFKDAVCHIAAEPGSVGTKLLAVKFVEIYVVLLTHEALDSGPPFREGKGRDFTVSSVTSGQPVFDQAKLAIEAKKSLGFLLDMLHSASTLRGSLVIGVINCLATIARKRPSHYGTILSALLEFDSNLETQKGGHTASIQYSVRTAFLGFLRCTHPTVMESRERVIRMLRAMNAGDAADQVMRQIEKMLKNSERSSRDARIVKEDPLSGPLLVAGDELQRKPMVSDYESPNATEEIPAKRARYRVLDDIPVNGVSSKVPLLETDLTPAEQMITMIGALLAQGERGFQSLELLISTIQPDLMADIVIANMRYLPGNPPPPSSNRFGTFPTTSQAVPSTTFSQVVVPLSAPQTIPLQLPGPVSPLASVASIGMSASDTPSISNISMELKRDPRRDPRRLDPRRSVVQHSARPSSMKSEDISDLQSESDGPAYSSTHPSVLGASKFENTSLDVPDSSVTPLSGTPVPVDNSEISFETKEAESILEVHTTSELPLSPVQVVDQDQVASSTSTDGTTPDGVNASSTLESDQYPLRLPSSTSSQEISQDLPLVPPYIELTTDQQKVSVNLAASRIAEGYKEIQASGCCYLRQALLAHLVAQSGTDTEIIVTLQKHIVLGYQQQKGHELALHILYYLHGLMVSESDDHAAILYEKFLLFVAKSLRDSLPASDKSFSRLLGEVPLLPNSALQLLEDLCHSDSLDKDVREGDRVTQGLGAVWSLILGRPPNRQACLDIALKCAVHSQDDIRAKAIRLVANKLYPLSYISEHIEKFATDMMLSVVEVQAPDKESRSEVHIGNQEASTSGSQNSEPRGIDDDLIRGSQASSAISFSQAQCHMSLFFALCMKKPALMRLVFSIYGRAVKTVKQAIHRHVPILVRTLGSSYAELLHIISDPPQGSENLLVLVLQTLTEETAPPADLVATIKHLYETKLQDAAILIPMLSSLSKDEVLPIFPRLVDLPLEKFQAALARILQGSAHTGPALTPAEVLVAIHDISPEKDGIALKKITDACSACFEQRTVFTQHVLSKSLNMLVEQTPLPLLFMRTVIQAIDAFPALVDFVMEILSKLVSKQIWKMPKLWVGFLKCASQTAPHSFRVLLQLPPPQLESALSRYANLRAPLAAHANQPSIRSMLPRSTVAVLGILNESPKPKSYMPLGLQTSDSSSSVRGATPT